MAKNVVALKQNPVPATPSQNPYAEYGDEAFASTIVGTLLKFNKGEWVCGREESELPEGTQLVAGMPTLQSGWIKWVDSKPAEVRIGLRSEGFRPAARSELGDDDKSKWPLLNGNPNDPWQRTDVLLLADPETGDVYTYSPASDGGLDAIKQLSKEYGTWYITEPDQMPVVALKSTWYKHAQYGKVFKPVLEVVGKRDINDVSFEVAEEEETAAKAPQKGKAAAKSKNTSKGARRY